MKSMEKWIVVSLVAGFVLGAATMVLVTSSCNLGGDSGGTDGTGGSGADFDASLYYTKTEVDDKLFKIVENETQSTPKPVTGNSYDTGTSFTVPDTNVKGVLLQVEYFTESTYNPPADKTIYLRCGKDTTAGEVFASFGLSTGGAYISVLGYRLLNNASTIKIWHDPTLPKAISSIPPQDVIINVKPVLWFR